MKEVVEKYLDMVREEFSNMPLTNTDMESNPFDLFQMWFKEVSSLKFFTYPESMVLSSSGPEGKISSRVMLLKSWDKNGFVFFTNFDSRKAENLNHNKNASLLFYWPFVERQVLICGQVEKVSKEESEQYFSSRPRGSKIGAWASPQSRKVRNREYLDEKFQEYEKKFENEEVPRPDFWGGYRLVPESIEFWNARNHRFHDRIQFSKTPDGKWEAARLAP